MIPDQGDLVQPNIEKRKVVESSAVFLLIFFFPVTVHLLFLVMLFMNINSFDPYNNLMRGHYISPTLAMKKKTLLFVASWMELEGISEISQRKTNTA